MKVAFYIPSDMNIDGGVEKHILHLTEAMSMFLVNSLRFRSLRPAYPVSKRFAKYSIRWRNSIWNGMTSFIPTVDSTVQAV